MYPIFFHPLSLNDYLLHGVDWHDPRLQKTLPHHFGNGVVYGLQGIVLPRFMETHLIPSYQLVWWKVTSSWEHSFLYQPKQFASPQPKMVALCSQGRRNSTLSHFLATRSGLQSNSTCGNVCWPHGCHTCWNGGIGGNTKKGNSVFFYLKKVWKVSLKHVSNLVGTWVKTLVGPSSKKR